MKNLYQIREEVVISAISGNLPTDAAVCLPASCIIFGINGSFYIDSENGKTSTENCFFIEADTILKLQMLTALDLLSSSSMRLAPNTPFLVSNTMAPGL